MGCLYFEQKDTASIAAHYIRGGRLASTLFGNKTVPPACDISIRSEETITAPGAVGTGRAQVVWYGRVGCELIYKLNVGLPGCIGYKATKYLTSSFLQVALLLSVASLERHFDVVYVRWFNAPAEDWSYELNLRPLQWHRCVTAGG
jgi:hypothetical protein